MSERGPEVDAAPFDYLRRDLDQLSGLWSVLMANRLDALPPPAGYVASLGNSSLCPYGPDFHVLLGLKEAGASIHLAQEMIESPVDGSVVRGDRLVVSVDPSQADQVSRVRQLTLGSAMQADIPFGAFTSSLSVGGFLSLMILPGQDPLYGNPGAREADLRRLFPDYASTDGGLDHDAAMALYVRGFLTATLAAGWRSEYRGRTIDAFADEFSYYERDWKAYNQLRSRGHEPLNYEQLSGIVAMQLAYIREHRELGVTILG